MRIQFLLLTLLAGTVSADGLSAHSPGRNDPDFWFDGTTPLDVTLSGPLSTLFRHKRERRELPFVLTINGESAEIMVRIRGRSRARLCSFPPLRWDISKAGEDWIRLAGGEAVKLVTHCEHGSTALQDAVLNELTAYRLFNVVSDQSYRVRLLHIRYIDTDSQLGRLDDSYFGFILEPAESLARRIGGQQADVRAIRYSALDLTQFARVSVFQYLIGNSDWSLIPDEGEDSCCHNLDLFRIDNNLVVVPYDFDLAALTQARYRSSHSVRRASRRQYGGYCRTPPESLVDAIEHLNTLQPQLLSTAAAVPALVEKRRLRRMRFIADFFDEAGDAHSLLRKFERNCVGARPARKDR